mmetsp:Transcript_41261/g.86610  ORF Transcript_41261/g.86610 Transcript_41261/m.86610 type:complete len:673 (-) Transcript_41261:145-2163(-)
MPRSASKPKPKAKKPAAKSKILSHTDDGIPIVNATMAQIRKGVSGKAAGHLVRIQQVAERSKLYAEAAEVIGERESLALPYHGGRMWRCEVKVSDENGACGSNCKKGKGSKGNKTNNNDGDTDETSPKKKRTNYKSPTPLFRWYRGSLVLATLPYILEDIVEVECKMPAKKRWANGLSDDEGLDSSDEEWDDDTYKVEPSTKMTMEMSAITASAYEDSSHPMPHITRSWISPDLQRFQSRKSAMAHSESLVKRDLLIDRALYGYGHNGVRLLPVKPTRKVALEAGMARFLRDGLWVVGQEEMWIAKRRDILVKKQEKRLQLEHSEDMEEGTATEAATATTAIFTEGGDPNEVKQPANESSCDNEEEHAKKTEAPLDTKPAAAASTAAPCNYDDAKAVVSPAESDASTEAETNILAKRATKGTRPPPTFTPSTHYRLTQSQIDQCFSACIDHYEKVMHTVNARSLHQELEDGFDVLRERGRGRFDMELDHFDTEPFSFLTDIKRAAWMPIVRKILGEDASLVHKGCFLSLPGSETQVYHQDGVHLNKKVHKPCYAINVFIPLVDMDMTNGPTEFCLGTHYLGCENFVKEQAYTPCVTAGTPVIFDYRLGHRGLRNCSQGVRPVVYLTYSSVASGKEFKDSVNFSRKRYRKLGDFAARPLSREERAQKRRRQEA